MQRNIYLAVVGLVLIAILPMVDPVSGVVTPVNATFVGIDVFPQLEPAHLNPRGAKPLSGDKPPALVPPIGAITSPKTFKSC